MAEPRPPALVKFVRRARQREPQLTFEQLLERWRAQPGQVIEVDAELVRTVYDEDVQGIRPGPPPREAHHSRVVIVSLAAWIGVHVVLLAAIGWPAYSQCRATEATPSTSFTSCGLTLGLTSLAIGWIQPWYGVAIGLVMYRRRPAIAQGIFIGLGIVAMLFTVVCFGGAFGG
jgi:hypothetical protein